MSIDEPRPAGREASRLGTQRQADLQLLAVAGAWGATFVMVKDALAEVGPLTFVALRFGLAAVALLPFVSWRRPKPGRLGLAGTIVGGCLFGGYALQTAGLQFTGAGRAGFITGLSVAIVPLLAALVGRQAVGRGVAVGVGLAAVGLALLSLRDLAGDPLATAFGDLLVLGCAFAFALHILAVGRYAPGHSALGLAFAQVTTVAVLGALAALVWEAPTLPGLARVWPAAAFTGFVCTALAFAVQTRAQRFTSPTHTALIFSAEPVFAAAFAYLLAGERLGTSELLGCTLILAGMLLAQLRPRG